MMRPAPDLPVVYLCHETVDFRKGLHALAVLVESQLKLDPFSAQLFAFRNRRATAVKERFHWPRSSAKTVVTINGQELNWLLDGYDIARMKSHKTLRYVSVL
jgi:transposase